MTATALADLELPTFDYLDPELRGTRFHAAMAELAERNWLATMPLGVVAVDRESGEFFLRSRSFTFPGMKIAEIFGIDDGPLFEEIRRNILHLDGPDHRRLRGLVNPYPPRVIATLMGAPREDADRLWDWSRWIQRQFGMKVLEERAQIERAVVEFYAYAGKLVGDRRADPKDDLITT